MAMNAPLDAAVFIDKDGTLIHDVPHNVDPARISLRGDAGPALARLQKLGFKLILVSNQPGIAHGYFEENALKTVWTTLKLLLAPYGVRFTGFYYCPHHPEGTMAEHAQPCLCRKPKPGMLQRAAVEHRLDLGRSWMIGDILDDVEAGRAAGCQTILLDVGSETEWHQSAQRRPHYFCTTLSAAADCIVGASQPALVA